MWKSSQSSSRPIRVVRTDGAGPPSTWQRSQVLPAPSAMRAPAIACGPHASGSKRLGASRRPRPVSTATPEKTALDLLDEAYARGDITREEYLRKRDDLLRR